MKNILCLLAVLSVFAAADLRAQVIQFTVLNEQSDGLGTVTIATATGDAYLSVPANSSDTAEGIALIRIVDQTGKVVLNDNEDATYAGQHFFYFSAKDLPAGTYYYTIEFPQGVVIANKTMLVVK